MSQTQPFELQLWASLNEAAQIPEEAALPQLWQLLDVTLAKLEVSEQLRVAAEAIAQIAEVFQERSVRVFEELEAATSDDGPIMPADAFDRYVRQTMQVDFDQFLEPPLGLPRKPPQRSPHTAMEAGQSVIGAIDQAALLQALDEQMSQEPGLTEAEVFNRALGEAHEEDISTWVAAIANQMQAEAEPAISLLELQRSVDMPLIQLWLALLLGEYHLEQRGEFYDTQHVWVLRH